MKNGMLKTLLILFTLVFVVSPAYSGSYTFTPSPPDLGDLDHSYFYEWGINWTKPAGETITSATISFINIYDWTSEPDVLYVNLLNTASSGVRSYYDGQSGGNNFPRIDGQEAVLLGTWTDPYGDYNHRTTVNFTISSDYYAWLSDGNFGFGVDPDCHYYNDLVELKIETSSVPEPSTLLLLGLGLLGTAALKRKRK